MRMHWSQLMSLTRRYSKLTWGLPLSILNILTDTKAASKKYANFMTTVRADPNCQVLLESYPVFNKAMFVGLAWKKEIGITPEKVLTC